MTDAREVALQTLYEVEYNGAYPNIALKQRLRQLDGRDRALAASLVYGVIKRRITLDYVIMKYSKIKLKKISKYILIILRMGIFQLMFTDRIHDGAAVNESVRLAKRYGHSASAGFVNGVLRSAAAGSVDYPTDKMENLKIRHSFPDELCREWVDEFGYEFTDAMMAAMNAEPQLTLRANTLKTTAEELCSLLPDARVSEIYKNAVLCNGFDIGASMEYNKGLFTVQDISAMMAGAVLNPQPGSTVLDICAAPGGKTTHLAELMQNKGRVLAFDVHAHKIELIRENAARMGADIIKAQEGDATVFNAELSGCADSVLADVPCSGLGIIRHKPDIKWKQNEREGLPQLQYSILRNAAQYVKPEGELVYSTCTISRQENEEIVERFLAENHGFRAEDITQLLPRTLQKPEAKRGYVTFYPHIDGIDGFFIAKLKRSAND